MRVVAKQASFPGMDILDLFDNPVGYRTSLGKMLRILLFFSGNCSETEVSEQLYYPG
jgi:hypothetical protein